MQNIILIGFMASGKDSVGQAIARRSGLTFLSTDRIIELAENRSIDAIFRENGEACFRRLEKKVLQSISKMKNIVLATGGGIVKDKSNRKRLARIGTVVHLQINTETVRKRTAGDNTRPLLKRPEDIEKLMRERSGMYDFADYTIDANTGSPEELAEVILRRIKFPEQKRESMIFQSIPVHTSLNSYNVQVGNGILERLPEWVINLPKRIAIISNPPVGGLYLDRLAQILGKTGADIFPVIIPDGERYKTLKWVSKIYDTLLENHFDRGDLLIGLGGGVITDITGFVAATLKRGCRLLNIPTTLLAQVDAGVGGKTGVNHASGKNLIGSFYQPEMVLADIELLQTLPDREFRNGLAEVIKTALIRDAELVDFLTREKDAVLHRDCAVLQHIVGRCIEIKRDIVERDEKEISGIRSLLNFGHTIGHIIEAAGHYRRFKHGEAIAIGMVLESRIGSHITGLSKDISRQISDLTDNYHLPVSIPENLSTEELKKNLAQDKKIRDGKIKFPVLTNIGESKIEELPWERFASYMDQI